MISLLFLALVAGLVWLVLSSRRTVPGTDRGVHTLRRFLQYTFLLVALFTAGSGLGLLLKAVLPTDTLADRRATDIALGVSLTVVAVPIWGSLWRVLSHRLAVDPDERASTGWALYLVAAATASLVLGYVQLVEVGRWLLGLVPYASDPVAYAVVWSGSWAAHAWVLESQRWRPTGRPAPLAALAGSVVGLVGMTVGGAGGVGAGLRELYRLASGPVFIDAPMRERLGVSVVVAAIGAAVWWWHWERRALVADRGGPWHVYVLLVGVLGGLLAAVIAGGAALHAVLQWWIGAPDAASAGVHFEVLPGAVATALVGTWVWWYHRSVLATGAGAVRTEPERVYGYLVSGVGLIAAAAGVTVGIMAAIQAFTPGALATIDPQGRNTLAVALTLLLVGAPLWSAFWIRLQGEAERLGRPERRSPTRRSYLVLLFGAGSVTAAVSVAVILFVVVRDMLERQLSVTVLHDLRAAIGLTVTAGATAIYHGLVHRRDRSLIPADEAGGAPRDILLVSSDGRSLVTAVSSGTHAHVHGLHRLDLEPHAIDPDRITAAITASPYERVLVLVDEDDEVRVIPYDRG